jgi:hypothetical protein
MAKTRMSNEKREALLNWMMTQYDEKNSKQFDKPRAKALKAMNSAIRKKYPEADMVVLRKYGVTRKDRCLRFVDAESNQFFGFDWGYGQEPEELADVPNSRGCRSDDVFTVSPAGREAIEALVRAKEDAVTARRQKERDYRSFLEASRYVEDVHDVVPLPEDMQRRFMSGAPLIPVNEELIASIKSEFAQAA